MRKLKQEKNELNKISKISLETKYCNKIFITIFLISIIIIVMQKSTFAATLKFTDGVHDGEKTIKIGDNWKSNGTLTPTNGSGTIKINGLTVPYYIQHAWDNNGTGMNHYVQLNYDKGYKAWYWYWSACKQASYNDTDKLTINDNTTYSATLHTRKFKNGVKYSTNTSISETSSGTLGADQYGGRNVTLPTQTMKTCYVRFNGNGGTASIASTTYNYSFSKYKCSASYKYTIYTNVENGKTYGEGQSVVVPIATSYDSDNETAKLSFTSYYNRPEIPLTTATRTGYIFNGWNTQADGQGTAYSSKISANSNITAPDISTDLTLYAQWIPITYTVKYNGNGSTGGTTADSSHTYDAQNNVATNGYERKYTVTFNGNGGTTPVSKTSIYAFYRWRQYANATGWSFTSGQTGVGNLSSSNGATVTLYAQWSPDSIKLPSTSRNAYSFAGWYYGESREGGIGDDYTPTSNIELIAKWNLITKSISGTINWNDQNNKYNSRPKNASGIETVNVTLNSDEPITETASGALAMPNTQTVEGENYTFSNLQQNKTKDNSAYTYTVTQNVLPGYETLIDGYTITNKLILPTYSSNITYTPINSFENRYLKNGKVKVIGEVTAQSDNRSEVGLNQGKAIFNIDSGITIDKNKIVVNYYNAETNTTTKLTNYTINGNTITAIFGKDLNGISKKGDKITIETEGTLTKLGGYSSNITATGNLRDYRGTNTTINLGDVTNTTKTINVDYQLPKANIKIQKIDSITKEKLTDATFTLYEWDGTKYVQKEIITDSNKDGIYESAYYEWNITTNGKYKIVETGIPEIHKDLNWTMEYKLNQLKTENYTVKPDYSNSEYKISYGARNPDEFTRTDGIVENEPWKLKAKIEKVDLETHNTIQSETQFTIYEWNQTNNSYELFISKATGKEVKMVRQSDKTYLSGEWLYYTQNNKGKYRIIETKAPQGYYANYDQAKQKITYDINIKDIINAGKFENQSINNEGTIFISNNNDLTLTNKRQKARLNLTVVDKETKSNAQADAVLQNAKYGIYALENIYHADGVTTRYSGTPGLLYKKDELIETQTSNEQGKMLFDNLECGKYYIKMLQAPEGYVIDETVYSIDFSYKGETVEIIEVNGILELKVKKQAFQMYKIKEDSTVLNNAGFSIYLVNDLSIVKQGKIRKVTTERYELIDTKAQKDERIKQRQNADGTYYLKDLVDYYYKIMYEEGNEQVLPGDDKVYHPYNLSSETLVKDYSNSSQGETIQEIRTNDKGYLKSPELAYGEYVAIETSVPRKQDTASPVVVKIEQDSRTLQDLRFVRDNNFRTKVKIYIRDVQTSQTILNKNIKYVIRNIDTQEYMTHKIWVPNEGYVEYGTPDKPFEAQKTGFIITPMKLEVGQYELIEITAGEGYTTNKFEGTSVNGQTQLKSRDNIRFEIRTNTAYYTDTYLGDYIIVVNETNKSVVGDITVKTQGEYLSNIVTDNNQNYSFEYTNRNVSNAKYQIIAKEDIYTQDNQGQKIYSKDEVVGYITTNEKGEGIIENLPLGKYIIKQVECPAGFTINTNDKEVEIDYQGQEVPVVFKNVEQEQIRQKIEILIHNKDEEEQNINRQGGKYGLYTKEEIRYTDKNGNVKIIPANTLLQTITSNENGEIRFNSQENVDLPQGKYYVKEIEAPEGYVLQEKQVDIDTIKDNQKQAILKIEKDLVGQKTNVKVQDINEEEQLVAGSKLQIVEKDTGKIIETWQTEAQIKTFRKLKVNTKYIVKQIEPARGYVTAEEVEFIIKTNGKIEINGQEQEENIINIISRQTKLDIILKDEIDSSYVSGVKFKILNKNTNEEMATFVMPASPQRVLGLPIGNYVLKEIEIPNLGYVTINDVDFEVRDTKDVQQLEIIQSVSKLEVHIFDELENTKYVEGTKWQIVDKETGKVKDEWVQDGNKHEVKKLPLGNYILKEVEVPSELGYVTIEDKEFEIKDTLEVQQVKVTQSVSKLEVHIFDELENEKYVEGTKWQIVEKDTGKIKDEWVQDGNKHEVKKLPLGNYILKEVEVPSELGYVTINDVEFTIKDTLEVQQVREIQSVSKLEVHIVDELDNTKYVEGTKWQIVEKDTGKVKDEWVQDGNKHEVKKLPLGNYILKEVEVPSELGYVTINDVEFTIKDTLEVQQVREIQSVSKLEVHIVDELDNTKYVEGTKWQIVEKDTGKVKDEWVQDGNKHEVKKLPLGNYILKEVEVPSELGYVTINDVEFTIKDTLEVQQVREIQSVSKLEVHIVDELDNTKYVEGTKWQIVEKDTGKVKDEWVQDGNKHEVKKLPLGNYILKEVEVPSELGYVTINDVEFTIKDTLEVQQVREIQSVSKLEVHIVDELDNTKYVEGTKWQIVEKDTGKVKDEWVQDGNKHEVKKLPLGNYILKEIEVPSELGYVTIEDKEFEVKDTLEVQQVRVTQSVSKLEVHIFDELENTKYVEGTKWQIVDKETGEVKDEWVQDGNKHEVKKLPLGNYILKEIEVPSELGYVTIEDKEFEVKDTLEVQQVRVTQSVSKLEVHIFDELENTKYVEGTKWQIVDKETGKVKDEWVQDGNKHEVKKLPLGNYILKEIEVPSELGYVTIEDKEFEVKDTLEVQQVKVTQSVSKLEVHIVDELDNTKYVEGTKWQIVDKETGEVKDEWVQDGNKHEVKKLPLGNYILKEIEVPSELGYVTIEDKEFEVKDTLEVQQVKVTQSVSKLEVHIVDELDNTKYVEGTKWQIVEKDTGKVKDEWVQDGNKHEVKKLPLGNYILKEVEVPSELGYVTIEDKEFEIKDTLEVQQVRVTQSVSKLEVHIFDELENTKYVEGTKWQIVDKETGKVKDEWVQDGNKHEVKKLPIGNYILKEVEVPSESGYVTIKDVEFEVKDTLEVQSVTATQAISKVNIIVYDKQTKEDITSKISLNIVNKETKQVVATTKEIKQEENNTKEEQSNVISNEIANEVVNSNSNEVVNEEINSNTNETIGNDGTNENETSNDDKVLQIKQTENGYYLERLPIGKYTIVETKIPVEEGFVEYQEIDMSVEDTLEIQKTEIYQDITKVLINVIDEETKELIEDANLQILDKETKQIIAQTKEEINDDKNDTTKEEETKEEINDNENNTTNEEETKEDKTLEIKKTKDGYYLERLPIGEYILIQQTKDGYHEIEQKEIKIENTKEIQKFDIINIRLKYDMKVEKQLEKITFDGEETLIDNSDVRKIEIRERKISTANVKLQYVIKVSNVGETDAKVGTIIDKIPEGFTLVPEESNGWIMDKNLATYKAYEDETIKPGETKQVSITVKWKNSVTNFGEKINTAMVVNSSNPYGYEDKNKENDEGKSLVVISVGTGIETAVTAARIIMVAFIGSMTVCLVAAIELMIKQKRKE